MEFRVQNLTGAGDLREEGARFMQRLRRGWPWRRAGLPEVGDGGEHGGESPEQDGDGRFKAKVAESGEELDRSGGLAVVGDARARRRSKRATSGLAAATGARAPASSGQNDGEERRGCQRARALVQRGKGTPGSCWSSSSAAIAGRRDGIERHGRRPPGVGDEAEEEGA